jgi:predicted transcriptional regulator YdeE/DNA-binding transcriptional MerR regulator
MFKIGDFSKLSRVPVKTLRYYDEIGLFKPRAINRYTHYRYYSLEQLPVLYRILALKELGFSLEQVGRLLSGDLSQEQLSKMLRARRIEIEQQINASQEQLRLLEARLQLIERGGRLPEQEVILKTAKAQWVAATPGTISSYEQAGAVFKRMFAVLQRFLDRHNTDPAGPGMVLYPEEENGGEFQLIEAIIPLPHRLEGDNGIRVYQLPAVKRLATVVHHGNLVTIGEAYQTLLAWIQANAFREAGPAREVFLRLDTQNEAQDCFVEVQFPVNKIRKDKKTMQPKIVHLEPFKIVGMRYFGKNENNEIQVLWDEFIPRMGEIRHVTPGEEISYGICQGGEEGEAFEYIAALPVSKLENIPSGMVGREMDEQTFVVMEAKGLQDIGPTYKRILEEWLPASDYQPGEGPDFELYPKTFEPEDVESVVYIYYPVKKKAA